MSTNLLLDAGTLAASFLALPISIWGLFVARRALNVSNSAADSARRSAESDERLAKIELSRWANEMRPGLTVSLLDSGGKMALFVLNKGQTDLDLVTLAVTPPSTMLFGNNDFLSSSEPGRTWGNSTYLGTMRRGDYLSVPLNPELYAKLMFLRVACTVNAEDPKGGWETQYPVFVPRPQVPAGEHGRFMTFETAQAIADQTREQRAKLVKSALLALRSTVMNDTVISSEKFGLFAAIIRRPDDTDEGIAVKIEVELLERDLREVLDKAQMIGHSRVMLLSPAFSERIAAEAKALADQAGIQMALTVWEGPESEPALKASLAQLR